MPAPDLLTGSGHPAHGVPGPGAVKPTDMTVAAGCCRWWVAGDLRGRLGSSVWLVRLPGKGVVRAGQFGFDLPAVAGEPPACPCGDRCGRGGSRVRTDQQWTVATHRAGEVADLAVGGAGGAVVGFDQLAVRVGFQPDFGQVGALLEVLLSDGGLVSAVRAGVVMVPISPMGSD